MTGRGWPFEQRNLLIEDVWNDGFEGSAEVHKQNHHCGSSEKREKYHRLMILMLKEPIYIFFRDFYACWVKRERRVSRRVVGGMGVCGSAHPKSP